MVMPSVRRCLPVLALFLFLMPSVGSGAVNPWETYAHETWPAPSRLAARLTAATEDSLRVWVFFVDKRIADAAAYRRALQAYAQTLTPHARQRRLLRREDDLVDIYDLPVPETYVRQTQALGARVRARSRWLNAVSVVATPDAIQRIRALPFVRAVTPVARFRRTPPPPPVDLPLPKPTGTHHRLDYGDSFTQLDQLRVPALHDIGLSGRGVLIALLDTGYHLNHEAFDSLRTRVVAEWDFIHNDGTTSDQAGQDGPGQHDHGTETLSVIGGFAPGRLIGPAYGARFLLAKTESIAFEEQIEEDWWMQAIEWADSLGADIVSSSLGYNAWYEFSDMDGQTGVTTRAAVIAVNRGIVVVNAMGNEGQSGWQKMIAPADADGIISVAAVDATGNRAEFSSKGPTFDGRIKPDVAAMGVSVLLANPGNATGYLRLNGTSFATPLVAGVAALLLEAFPHWTPVRMLQALQTTASQAAAPDTLLGYGIADALDALLTDARTQVADFNGASDSTGVLLSWTSTLEINIQGWRILRENLDAQGTPAQNLTPDPIPANQPPLFTGTRTYFFLDTTAVAGQTYQYTLESVSVTGATASSQPLASAVTFTPADTSRLPQFALHQNAPNPFNPATEIAFVLPQPAHVTLVIYNVLGQQVRTLVDAPRDAGRYVEVWDGRDGNGHPLASGVYLYRLTAGAFVSTKKMTLLR